MKIERWASRDVSGGGCCCGSGGDGGVLWWSLKWLKESRTSSQVQLQYYEYVQLSHPLSISLWRINRLDWIVILCTGHLFFTINSANCFYLVICRIITRAISNGISDTIKRCAGLETIDADIKPDQRRFRDLAEHVDMRIQASFSWVSWVSYRLHRQLLVHCSVIVTVRSIVQQCEASSFTTPFCMMSKGVSSSASSLSVRRGRVADW